MAMKNLLKLKNQGWEIRVFDDNTFYLIEPLTLTTYSGDFDKMGVPVYSKERYLRNIPPDIQQWVKQVVSKAIGDPVSRFVKKMGNSLGVYESTFARRLLRTFLEMSDDNVIKHPASVKREQAIQQITKKVKWAKDQGFEVEVINQRKIVLRQNGKILKVSKDVGVFIEEALKMAEEFGMDLDDVILSAMF